MSFEVNIKLNKRNYFDCALHEFCVNAKRSSRNYILIFFITVAFVFAVFGLVMIYKAIYANDLSLFSIFYFILCLIVGFCIANFRQGGLFYFFNEKEELIKQGLNEYKLIFYEDKFVEENKLETQKYIYSAIYYVVETKNYLFLHKYSKDIWTIPKEQLNENTYKNIINFLRSNNIDIKKDIINI